MVVAVAVAKKQRDFWFISRLVAAGREEATGGCINNQLIHPALRVHSPHRACCVLKPSPESRAARVGGVHCLSLCLLPVN